VSLCFELYVYPHPTEAGVYLYVGYGRGRDEQHRHTRTNFGKQFTLSFPGMRLPDTVSVWMKVSSIRDIKIAETAMMFKLKTHKSFGGFNMCYSASLADGLEFLTTDGGTSTFLSLTKGGSSAII
jgi:hypothetical protein